MASFITDQALYSEATGDIVYSTNTFKVMLLTGTATPSKTTWMHRSDVTNEVVGTGYTTGGATATFSVAAQNTSTNQVVITLGGATWTSSTITAAYAVYYKSTGSAATDTLVAVVDFGGNVTSTNASFTLTSSTITKQN